MDFQVFFMGFTSQPDDDDDVFFYNPVSNTV